MMATRKMWSRAGRDGLARPSVLRESRRIMKTQDTLDIRSEGNVAIACFTIACITDTEEIAGASARLKEYIEAHRPAALIFDFAGVRFFSSQVLGLLLEARARLGSGEGQVAVTALSPQLERVFRITNLNRIFRFYPDRAAALAQSPARPN
jgi:anti-sigma B factor antagonist